MTDPLHLVLFVTGDSSTAAAAIINLRRLVELLGEDRCNVEIVDTQTSPEKADAARVMATPLLVRMSPPPRRRVIGDLSQFAKVATGLGLEAELSKFRREAQDGWPGRATAPPTAGDR